MTLKITQFPSPIQERSSVATHVDANRTNKTFRTDAMSSKEIPYTLGESVLGVIELLLVVTAIVLCIQFPQPFMLIILAGLGLILVGLAHWSDSISNRR